MSLLDQTMPRVDKGNTNLVLSDLAENLKGSFEVVVGRPRSHVEPWALVTKTQGDEKED